MSSSLPEVWPLSDTAQAMSREDVEGVRRRGKGWDALRANYREMIDAVEVVQEGGVIFTLRDSRIARIEFFLDRDEALGAPGCRSRR
jgi:hypothetical protein